MYIQSYIGKCISCTERVREGETEIIRKHLPEMEEVIKELRIYIRVKFELYPLRENKMKNKFSITTTSCETGIGYTSYNRGYLKLNQFTELITNMFSARRCGYNRFTRSSLENKLKSFSNNTDMVAVCIRIFQTVDGEKITIKSLMI